MGKEAIIAALNQDRADELAAITQYISHYYQGQGKDSPAIRELFRQASIDEMRHAEKLAERIVYLGGSPTYQSPPYKKGGDLREMIQDDLEAENRAIARYKEHIKLCADESDSTSRALLEEILAKKEEHAREWQALLGRLP